MTFIESSMEFLMPIVTLPIPDAYESSTRPIAVQIAKNIVKDYAAPKGARIVFPGDTNKIAQPKTVINDTRDKEGNFLQTDSTINITVEEQPIEDRILATAVTRHKDENICIFLDKELGIKLKPVYTPTETTISFRLRFRDKTIANRWRDGVKSRYSMGRAEVIHKVTYHYGIPPEMVYMIYEMHRIRERVAPLNESLRGWFERCFDARLTTVTNQAGNVNTGIIAMPENQIGILGWFDFTYIPDKNEKENDTGVYTCGFDYKFQYDKVTDLVLEYPVIIHNQVLPKTIRDDQKEEVLDTETKFMQHSKSLFEFMTSQDPRYLSSIEGYGVPFFDDWLVNRIPRGVSTLFHALVEIDPLDKRDLFNIEDIEELEFKQEILDFLPGEADFIAEIGKSIFYANMYEGEVSTGMNKVTMNATLDFRTVDEMDLRLINHFHFGIITDWTMLDQAALDRLRKNPTVFGIILDNIDPSLKDRCNLTPMSNGYISWKSVHCVIQALLDNRYNIADQSYGDYGSNYDEQHRRLTTGIYKIVAVRERI